MPRTKIEWCDYTINPVKGKCPMACPYCYARRMYDRFKWNPEIRYDSDWWQSLRRIKSGKRIFIGSTVELFHPKTEVWWPTISKWVHTFYDLTFIFLTKCPQNLPKEFPENCYVGVTATNEAMLSIASNYMARIKAKVKFYSFEPLLHWDFKADWDKDNQCLVRRFKEVDWIIIGQQTPVSKKTEPKIEWVKEIVEAADQARIPVFLKDNLKPLLETLDITGTNFGRLTSLKVEAMKDTQGLPRQRGWYELRQELPIEQ